MQKYKNINLRSSNLVRCINTNLDESSENSGTPKVNFSMIEENKSSFAQRATLEESNSVTKIEFTDRKRKQMYKSKPAKAKHASSRFNFDQWKKKRHPEHKPKQKRKTNGKERVFCYTKRDNRQYSAYKHNTKNDNHRKINMIDLTLSEDIRADKPLYTMDVSTFSNLIEKWGGKYQNTQEFSEVLENSETEELSSRNQVPQLTTTKSMKSLTGNIRTTDIYGEIRKHNKSLQRKKKRSLIRQEINKCDSHIGYKFTPSIVSKTINLLGPESSSSETQENIKDHIKALKKEFNKTMHQNSDRLHRGRLTASNYSKRNLGYKKTGLLITEINLIDNVRRSKHGHTQSAIVTDPATIKTDLLATTQKLRPRQQPVKKLMAPYRKIDLE